MTRGAIVAIIAAAMVPGLRHSAVAITINDTAGAATAIGLGAPQAGTVEIFIGGGLCSGALIDATHVITAQHCTFGAAPGVMTVNFDSNGDGTPEATRTVTAKAEIDGTNVLLDGTDISVLTLSAAAPPFATPLQFLTANPTGQTGQTVGFGTNGLGSVGTGGTRDGRRWAADNVIDSFGAALDSAANAIGGSANILNSDFDDGTVGNNKFSPIGSSATPLTNEGSAAPGDSGGPLLVNGRIVGVVSGGTTIPAAFGNVMWWTGTTMWQTFIQQNAPGATFVVPEPSSFALAAISIACVGGYWHLGRRRRRR